MSTVLAAIDGSPVSALVLQDASAMATLLDADCQAIHVRDPALHGGRGATASRGTVENRLAGARAIPESTMLRAARTASEAARVPLRVVDGPPDRELEHAFAARDVVLGVLGARANMQGPRPAGHTATTVLAHVGVPLVVVPPGSRPLTTDLKRVLLPLDGEITTKRAVEDAVALLARCGAEIVVLHSFTPATIPPFWDGTPQNQTAWEHEFLARYCAATSCRLVLRTGEPDRHVVELARSEGADLIALGWHQDLTPAHAAVVRETLRVSPAPILLLPAGRSTLPNQAGRPGRRRREGVDSK